MTKRNLAGLLILCFGMTFLSTKLISSAGEIHLPARLTPRPPKLSYSVYRTAPILVAGVFGRSAGCDNLDTNLVMDTANAALDESVDPEVMASIIAVESACNPYAVSAKGAVGLGQINVSVWRKTYDFQEQVNLFNPLDNLKITAKILSGLINQYGVREAVTRYQGLGIGGDPQYVSKILSLARR